MNNNETIFSRVPVQKRNLALQKLLDAAVDANNRELECRDRGHGNMAVLYSSIFLLCMRRLRVLAGLLSDPQAYRYFSWENNYRTQGHYLLMAEVRQWRWKYKRVRRLGNVPREYI